jgi:hypothetical protein
VVPLNVKRIFESAAIGVLPVCAALLLLSTARPAVAQEWVEFASTEDRFTANFPSQPKVTDTIWVSEYGAELPARVYSAETAASRYSMTVVDYNQAERVLTEKSRACPAGAEPCKGSPTTGAGYYKVDVRGAIVFASWKLMQRDAKLTHYMWNFMDLVEGHQLQLTNNADKSRTFASIYMHQNKLYVMEATVPAGYPEPGLFQQSLGWLDEDGIGLRYQSIYTNGFPAPPRVNRAGQRQGQGRIDAPGANAGQAGHEAQAP